MRGKLERITGGKAMRTNEVIGEFSRLPRNGLPFVMVAESLTPGARFREVSTSKVKTVTKLDGNAVEFTTETGSHYKLTSGAYGLH